MNCFEAYLVELLQGYITYDNKAVQVVKHFSNAPELPVITLDLSGGVNTDYLYRDVDGGKEVMYYRRTANININLWCNTDAEKENITSQIMDCFYKEQSNHYRYCSNYDNGACGAGGYCKVGTIPNGRSAKNKCPAPDEYNYDSLALKHHLIEGTIMVEPPFDMDEFDRQPPLLRSIFRCKADYEEPVLEQGATVEDVDIEGVDIV